MYAGRVGLYAYLYCVHYVQLQHQFFGDFCLQFNRITSKKYTQEACRVAVVYGLNESYNAMKKMSVI